MTEDEKVVQYIKIALGVLVFLTFVGVSWGIIGRLERIEDYLSVIAVQKA